MLADVPRDELQVVEQPHRGVTAAWDLGARQASTPYLVFLNNDTIVEGPVVDRLVGPLRDGRAVVAGCETRCEARLPRSVAARLPSAEFLAGWCFAVVARHFESAGGFDETLELYWSDTDFQARVLRDCGVGHQELECVHNLPIRHLRHRTAHTLDDHREQWHRDRGRFFRKWSRMW
jgi:GT2 family glycosyltransferase